MEQTGSQRVACYDVLRVAATFAVVALHLSAQHWADTDIYSTAWQAFNLYDSLVRWTVPVFVMISGVFFLAGTQSLRQILRKNVLRIVTAFIFWSALYAAYAYFFNKCALSTAVTLFFSGHYHMWFLFMIVGLYLIVPLLRPIAQNETLLRYFLLLALVFNFLLPQLGALLSLFSWPLYSSYLSLSGMLYYHFTLGFAALFYAGPLSQPQGAFAQSGPLVLCARRSRSHRHRRYDVLCFPPSGHRHRALLQLRLGRCAADVSRRLCIRP